MSELYWKVEKQLEKYGEAYQDIKSVKKRLYNKYKIDFTHFSEHFCIRVQYLQKFSKRLKYHFPVSEFEFSTLTPDEEEVIFYLIQEMESRESMKWLEVVPQIMSKS